MAEQKPSPLELPGFPQFPTLFGEDEANRLKELEKLAAQQQEVYGTHFAPEIWQQKSVLERTARGLLAEAYNPPSWFRRITPWTEFGYTPEQADAYIRETEAAKQELAREQRVIERTPDIRTYLTGLALLGRLTGEDAQLYELIPELDPDTPELERLPVNDAERAWFLAFNKALAGKSKEDIAKLYTDGFPAPQNLDELMKLVSLGGLTQIGEEQLLSAVAFSNDIEQIKEALQLAYPPTVANPDQAFEDNITNQIEQVIQDAGVQPTGDIHADIEAARLARLQQIADTGVPESITFGTPGLDPKWGGVQTVVVDRKADGMYFGGEKIANIDAGGNVVPLPPAEEYELQSTNMTLGDSLKRLIPGISEEAIQAFWTLRSTKPGIIEWYKTYVDPTLTDANATIINVLNGFSQQLPANLMPQDLSLLPTKIIRNIGWDIADAWFAGWGDVFSTAGSAMKWMGIEGIGNTVYTKGRDMQSIINDDLGDFRWSLLANPRFWALRGVRSVPFTLSLLPAALFGWEAGAAVAGFTAFRLGLGVFGKTILTAILGGGGGALASRPLESAMEAGGAYDDAKRRGADDLEADAIANEVFWNNMKLTGMDAAEIAASFTPLPIKAPANAIVRGLFRVARVGGRMVVTGLTEAGEEGVQEVIQRMAAGEEVSLDAEMWQAMVIGGMMGTGMGAGGDVLSGIINDTKSYMTIEQSKAYEDTKTAITQEYAPLGWTEEQIERTSDKIALDELAETEEGAQLIQKVVEVAKEKALNREIKNPAKRVYTKSIAFLQEQLAKIDDEINQYTEKYNDAIKRSELASSPADKKAARTLAEEIDEATEILKQKRARIDKELKKNQSNQRKSTVSWYEEGVPVPRETEVAWLDEAEADLEGLPPTERDEQGNIKPGLHVVPIYGGYSLIVTNEEGRIAVAAKVLDRGGVMTLSSIVAEKGISELPDLWAVYDYMKANNVVFPPRTEMSPTALRLTELLERRQARAGQERKTEPALPHYTPIEDIAWDSDITPRTRAKVDKAIRTINDVVRVNIKAVHYDPGLWDIEHAAASYSVSDGTITIGYQDIEDIHIYHEIGHQLSMYDVEEGTYEMWRAVYGDTVVRRLERDMNTAKNEEEVKSGHRKASQYLYNNSRWFQELEEALVRNFSEYCSGIPVEGDPRYAEALKNWLGGYVFEFSLSRENLASHIPDTNYILNAYFLLSKLSRNSFMHMRSPDSSFITLPRWIRTFPDRAWLRLLDNVLGVGKPSTPETVYTLYRLMGVVPRVTAIPLGASYLGVATREIKAVTPDFFHTTQELENGQVVDTKEATRETKPMIGFPERTIDISDLRQTRIDAQRITDEQLYTADLSNPLDKAIVTAAESGSIQDYVNLLPPDIGENVSQEFKDGKFSDSSRWNLNFQPVIDAAAVIDNGRFGGLIRKKVINVGVHAYMASQNYQGAWSRRILDLEDALDLHRPSWVHPKERAKFDETTYTIIDNIATEDILLNVEELRERYPAIETALQGFTDEEKSTVIEYAKSMRLFFDEVIADVNAVRMKLGRAPIQYLEHYLPEVYKVNVWGRFLGIKLRPDFLMEAALAPDFIKPDSPFNPHALQREGGLEGYEKVRNVRRLFLDYVSVASKEMFFTPAILNTKAHAKVLKNKGLEVPSAYLIDWATRSMVGSPDGLTRWRMENVPPFLYNPVAFMRSRLTPAVLGLNPMWNLFLQTSATAMCSLQFGTKNTIKGGIQYLVSRDARRWVQERCPSFIIKQRGRGSVVYQDMGHTVSESRRLEMSPLEKADQVVLFLVNLFEKHLTGMACQAAKLRGQELGITTEADLVEFASDGGAKTQSMYDDMHLPMALSPTVRFLVPFQTFAFEVLTRVREMSNISKLAKAGTYETVAANSIEGKGLKRIRLQRFLEFGVAIWLFNILGEYFNDRKPWEGSSFVPFFNIMMMGVEPNNAWNSPFMARYVNDMYTGLEDMITRGSWEGLTKWALRYHIPAGSQAWKTLNGIIAVIEGGEKDISGDIMFELESDPKTWLQAVALGVWGTEPGKDWIKRNLEGEPMATQDIVNKSMSLEDQLGSSVKGEYYTLNDYGTEVMGLLDNQGIPSWQIVEEPIYPPLVRFRAQCEIAWEEYMKTPGEDHVKYRVAHPYIDAILYFWEKVRTVRTAAAKDELEKLFEYFEVGENPRMHWRGLPVIPEWVKLLPE